MSKDYYAEIDKHLTRLEQGKYAMHDIDWCIKRVDWAWKWRKITKEQMDELAGRCCVLLDAQLAALPKEIK